MSTYRWMIWDEVKGLAISMMACLTILGGVPLLLLYGTKALIGFAMLWVVCYIIDEYQERKKQ